MTHAQPRFYRGTEVDRLLSAYEALVQVDVALPEVPA